uniref:Uncharacterized protein n=1 Tax=Rhizophora mucronata TaxID=61149 RepID=A0A2P2ILF6_RHIMU
MDSLQVILQHHDLTASSFSMLFVSFNSLGLPSKKLVFYFSFMHWLFPCCFRGFHVNDSFSMPASHLLDFVSAKLIELNVSHTIIYDALSARLIKLCLKFNYNGCFKACLISLKTFWLTQSL